MLPPTTRTALLGDDTIGIAPGISPTEISFNAGRKFIRCMNNNNNNNHSIQSSSHLYHHAQQMNFINKNHQQRSGTSISVITLIYHHISFNLVKIN